MPIDFAAIDTRLNRAERHGTELFQTIREIIDGPPPYEVRQEPAPEGGLLWRLRIVQPLPELELATIAGDVAHSLRTALDYLADGIVTTAGGTPTDSTAFPVWTKPNPPENSHGWEAKVRRSISSATGPHETILHSLEPWNGGKHERLWVLHQLNVIDKHRHLVVAGSSSRSVGWSPMEMMAQAFPDMDFVQEMAQADSGTMLHLRPADNQFPLKDGAVLLRDRTSSLGDVSHEFRFEVALGEPEAIKGRPVHEALGELAAATQEVVDLFR